MLLVFKLWRQALDAFPLEEDLGVVAAELVVMQLVGFLSPVQGWTVCPSTSLATATFRQALPAVLCLGSSVSGSQSRGPHPSWLPPFFGTRL